MTEVWTLEAKETFKNNINFLERKFTEKEVNTFVSKSFEIIDYLLKGNINGQYDKKRNAHKFLIVSQIYLFYRINNNRLILLTFWNNYQHPLIFD